VSSVKACTSVSTDRQLRYFIRTNILHALCVLYLLCFILLFVLNAYVDKYGSANVEPLCLKQNRTFISNVFASVKRKEH